MRKLNYLLFSIFALYLFSCREDDNAAMPLCDPIPPAPCEQVVTMTPYIDTCFEIESPPQTWVTVLKDYSAVNLGYKPGSEDEFLFHRGHENQTGPWIGRVNLCTGEINHVVSKGYLGKARAKWGENDWVIFGDENLRLWKVKIDGTGLEQFTEERYCYPTPVYDNLIVATRFLADQPNVYASVLLDLEGNEIDTFEIAVKYSGYYNNKLATSTNLYEIGGEIGYVDLSTGEFIAVAPLGEENIFVGNTDWLDENTIVFQDKKGLHMVDINDGEIITLKEQCDNNSMRYISATPGFNSGNLLLGEFHYWPMSAIERCVYPRIFKYDTNTGEQWEIDLSP